MQLLHLVWLNVVGPEGLWWEGAALFLGHKQTAENAKLSDVVSEYDGVLKKNKKKD